MTRINVVPVIELCNKHLFAEYREMPRLVTNLKQSLNRKSKEFCISEIPCEYVLGKGHVKFFFDKFKFLHDRHVELTKELLRRGYSFNNTDSSIFKTVDLQWYGDYVPTCEDIALNRKRIIDKMPTKPKWTVK